MAKPQRSLVGKVVVVTGGGRGIGRAIAEALAAEGARVAIGDVDAAEAERTAAAIGRGTLALPLDVTDRPGFTRFLDEVEARLGPVEILVNNAGIMAVGPLDEEEDAVAIRQLEVNLHAVLHGTKEAMRRMRPRRTGHIVNVASTAGKAGFPHLATYCATKHGVVGLSEAVRAELRGTGVEISVVMPGIVKTELSAGLKETRGVKTVAVEDVAAEVLDALRRPRFDVFVPRNVGPIVAFFAALPRPAREAVGRLMRTDRALLDADTAARAAYERRAAASAPATDLVVEATGADREPAATP